MTIAASANIELALRVLIECGCVVEQVGGTLNIRPPQHVSSEELEGICATVSTTFPLKLATSGRALTPQQIEILLRLGAAKANKQIAYELGITETTVKAHVTNIYRRLGVRNRAEALILVQRQQLAANLG